MHICEPVVTTYERDELTLTTAYTTVSPSSS